MECKRQLIGPVRPKHKSRLAVLLISLLAGAVTVCALGPRNLLARLYLLRARVVAERGEQMWGDEVSTLVGEAEEFAPDKHRLAEQLLAERNSSLVAEG